MWWRDCKFCVISTQAIAVDVAKAGVDIGKGAEAQQLPSSISMVIHTGTEMEPSQIFVFSDHYLHSYPHQWLRPRQPHTQIAKERTSKVRIICWLHGNLHWHTFAEPIDEDELDRISKSQYLSAVILHDGCICDLLWLCRRANIKRKWVIKTGCWEFGIFFRHSRDVYCELSTDACHPSQKQMLCNESEVGSEPTTWPAGKKKIRK